MHLPANEPFVLKALLDMQSEASPAQDYREVAARTGLSSTDGYDTLCALQQQGLVSTYDEFQPDGSRLLGWQIPDVERAEKIVMRAELLSPVEAGPRRRVSELADAEDLSL